MTTADPLVSTAWLAERLDDPRLRVVDASYKMPAMRPPTAREDYAARHIPGAVFFDVDVVADQASSLPHMIPTAEEFARHVGTLGIADDSQVVVYDAGTYLGAPRAWWMFRLFGHDDVKVLDGGLKKWMAEGRPVDAAPVLPRPASFTARFAPAGVRRLDQMVANLDSRAEQVVDARARDRFAGEAAEPWPGRRAGHIPGSRNVPFNELIDPATGTMKPADELRRIFAAAKLDLGRPIVTSCGSGITAAVVSLALARVGIDDAALYDGSWSEWGLPGGPPVATGPA